jgi:hypothetical protein
MQTLSCDRSRSVRGQGEEVGRARTVQDDDRLVPTRRKGQRLGFERFVTADHREGRRGGGSGDGWGQRSERERPTDAHAQVD